MTAELMIDLDLPGPDRPRRRPGRRMALRYRLAGLVTVALVVALVGGPDAPPYRPVFDPPLVIAGAAESVQLGDDALYITGPSVAAYRLTDGRRMWTVDERYAMHVPVLRIGGTLLASTQDATVGLDPGTGALRWTVPGDVLWGSNTSGRLATMRQDLPVGDDPQAVNRLAVFDAATGATLWTAAVRQYGQTLVFGTTAFGVGAVGVLLDGWYLPFETLIRQPVPGIADHTTMLSIVDDLLLVTDSVAGGTRAIELSAGRTRWTRPEAADDAKPCGPLLCLNTGHGMVAVDPATGKPRWWDAAAVIETDGALTGEPRLSRLLSVLDQTVNGVDIIGLAVLDPSTGRLLRRFPGWQAVPTTLPRRAAAQRSDDGHTRLPRRFHAVPVQQVYYPTGETTLAVLDLDRLLSYPIATMPKEAADSCRATATHLVCPSGLGEVRVWRYAA